MLYIRPHESLEYVVENMMDYLVQTYSVKELEDAEQMTVMLAAETGFTLEASAYLLHGAHGIKRIKEEVCKVVNEVICEQ